MINTSNTRDTYRYPQKYNRTHVIGVGSVNGADSLKTVGTHLTTTNGKATGNEKRGEISTHAQARQGLLGIDSLFYERDKALKPLTFGYETRPRDQYGAYCISIQEAEEITTADLKNNYPHLSVTHNTTTTLQDAEGNAFTGKTGQSPYINQEPIDLCIGVTGSKDTVVPEDRFSFYSTSPVEHFTACFTGLPLQKACIKDLEIPQDDAMLFYLHNPDRHETHVSGFLRPQNRDLTKQVYSALRRSEPSLPLMPPDMNTVCGSTREEKPSLKRQRYHVVRHAVAGDQGNYIRMGDTLATSDLRMGANIPSFRHQIWEMILQAHKEGWTPNQLDKKILDHIDGKVSQGVTSADISPQYPDVDESLIASGLEQIIKKWREHKIPQKDDYTPLIKAYTETLNNLNNQLSSEEGIPVAPQDLKNITDTICDDYAQNHDQEDKYALKPSTYQQIYGSIKSSIQ